MMIPLDSSVRCRTAGAGDRGSLGARSYLRRSPTGTLEAKGNPGHEPFGQQVARADRLDRARDAMTELDRLIQERNRELLAQRLNWPPGALDHCREIEREFPGWYAWWSASHGGFGASPADGPAIRSRTYYSPTAEGLRTQLRQDIERHETERERNARLRAAMRPQARRRER